MEEMIVQIPEKDRRMCTSTFKIVVTGAVIGLFILTFSFSHAWGEYEKQIESRSSTAVFATIALEDFEGQPFTRDDLRDTKLVAYNVWETT